MIALIIAAILIHEAIALWDVSYAETARRVFPIEQHVHSFLEMIPHMAAISVATLHWPQLLALFGTGSEPARFDLAWKNDPLPNGYIASIMAAIVALELLPYLEEYVRGRRASTSRLKRGSDNGFRAHRQ